MPVQGGCHSNGVREDLLQHGAGWRLLSTLWAAETLRVLASGEKRDESGSTVQLPGAGGSLLGRLHMNHPFPMTIWERAALLCGFW